MSSIGEIMFNSINSLKKYKYNGEEYVSTKDLLDIKEYGKGCNASQDRMIKKKNLNEIVNGRVGLDDETIVLDSVISKRYTKKFAKLSEVLLEFNYLTNGTNNNNTVSRNNRWILHDQRPLIKPDGHEFAFFRDNNGVVYDVEMRGERTKNGIIFKCKDLEKVFEMDRLHIDLIKDRSGLNYDIDMLYCNMGTDSQTTDKELYLTFNGLLKVINNSRTGRAKEFKDWVEDIVFASIVGTSEQRHQAAANVLDITTKAIVKALSKCSGDISCLYLLSTGIKENDKKVYKFGRTKHLDTRIKQHITTFGENLKLVKYCIISDSDLVEAENMLKERAEDFRYESKDDKYKNMTELIIMNKKEKEYMLERMLNISSKFKFDSKQTIESIQRTADIEVEKASQKIYIMEVKHQAELEKAKRESEMLLKDLENEKKLHEMEKMFYGREIAMKDKIILLLEQTNKTNSL